MAAESQALYAPPFGPDAPTRERLETLRVAAESRHKPHFDYTNLKGAPSQHTVRPLGCFYWGEVRTLAAWREARDDFHSFRVDRIAALQVLPERFRDLPGKTLAGLFAMTAWAAGSCRRPRPHA